jgi:hypothetical protein
MAYFQALGAVTLLCDGPRTRTTTTFTDRAKATAAYEACIRDERVTTAEVRDDGSVILASYRPVPKTAATVMAAAFAAPAAPPRAKMSKGIKIGLALAALAGIYLVARK